MLIIPHQTLCNHFVYDATSFLNNINTQPNELDEYGSKIMLLSTDLGVSGLETVVTHHLALTEAKDELDRKNHLMWSDVPYHIVTHQKKDGKLRVELAPPKDQPHLREPTYHQIMACFYDLMIVAITGKWEDASSLSTHQVRFLIRLSGLKFKNVDKACPIIKQLKKGFKRTRKRN